MRIKPKIVIVDDDSTILNVMEEMLTKKCTYCSIHCFDKVDSKLINFLENNEITLYIIDIELGDKSNKGTDLALKIAHNKTGSIILFMSGYDYTINSFSDFKGKVIYDFIKKPFSYEELASRISVLLNVSQTYNELETRLRNTRHAVWDMMNYTKMFVVILDENLKVKIANWYLATELGFENEDDLLDKCWLQFVDEQKHDLIKRVHSIAISEEFYKVREVVNEIITLDGKIINVKWFNTKINDKYHWSFSIGIPMVNDTLHAETEETIRSYYKDIIARDRTMIEALRDTILDEKQNSKTICE